MQKFGRFKSGVGKEMHGEKVGSFYEGFFYHRADPV